MAVTLGELDIYVYDFEVFAHDWLVVLKHAADGERTHFWNEDGDELLAFMKENGEGVFAGFNSKHYDQYILKAIAAGCSPEEVKEVNDWIIGGNQGWEHPFLQDFYYRFNQTDLMDDVMKGTSLKMIEGHLGMSIEESSVPFDIDRKLTEAEREEVLRYCEHDVDATEELLMLRSGYLETKLHLAPMADVDQYRALGMTDPKLAAALFKARPFESDDERDYEFPDRLDYGLVPDEVRAFFDRVHDPSLTDEELFSSKLEIEIAGCPVTYAWGGVHGAVAKARYEAEPGWLLLNYDVSSLYPSLMIEYGYVSRAVPSPDVFRGIRDERFAAKRRGDKQTANALKSPLNKTYGAMGNKYNDMYDPKMKLSVCISGQLSITVLAKMYERIEGLIIIQLNTDGIAIRVPEERYGDVLEANRAWEEMTSLELEEDRIALIWQKDVNNYAMRKTDGSEKVKGGYLVRGISPIGAWSINNNAVVVAEAIRAYLLDGTPVEDTVLACDDPAKFQIIAKAGGKYSRVYQIVDGGEVPVQKCNRVFASRDASLGRLYKVKRADGSVAKIESLPDNCLISNGGMPDTSEIDKGWYVELARKRAADFERGEEKMPAKTAAKAATDYKSMNIYQKLAAARKKFSDANPKKSGMNDHLEFEYFELGDIVPLEVRIFEEVGLLEHSTKVLREVVREVDPGTGAVSEREIPAHIRAEVVNVDAPEERLVFTLDWPSTPPIKNRDGKDTGNPLQRLGSEQTYLRRYIKQLILDVCDPDETDASLGSEPKPKETARSAAGSSVEVEAGPKAEAKPKRRVAAKPASKAKPAAGGDRKATAKKLADPDGKASRLQIQQLKKSIRTVKEACGDDPEVAQLVAQIGVETDNLKGDVTKKACEGYIRALGELKEKHEKGEE